MNSQIVIAAYRAVPERKQELLDILKIKRTLMLSKGYYSQRPAVSMASKKDPDLVIEVIEWTSSEAIGMAHSDVEVLEIWKKMDEICYEIGSRLNSFPEADNSFPGFEPIDLDN